MMKASFMQRFFAYLIDMIIIAVVSVFVGLLIPIIGYEIYHPVNNYLNLYLYLSY